ncbi:MAG TPA: hypothetical protein VFO94_10110 [Gammaproteobacteria bacterium]|nr:hypothetical protein [Gammaproteobacteria bacterium]
MRLSSSTLNACAAVLGIALHVLPGTLPLAATPAPTSQPTNAVPDRFTAKTTGMTPEGVTLKIDVLRWSDDDRRAAVVAALTKSDPIIELSKLPTLGYVWAEGMPIGMSVKYAYRTPTPNGERITLVTDHRLGWTSFKPWTVKPPLEDKDFAYGVVELYLDRDGRGTGTFSLAADVKIDEAGALVSLADGAPQLLTDARAVPKPYYVTQGSAGSK